MSSNRIERIAFATLCTSYEWGVSEFDCVHTAVRQFNRFIPKVVLLRHKLSDGYSDDVIPKIRQFPGGLDSKIVVLVEAGLSSVAEARQLNLGADCVLRDPVRIEILTAYIEKFLAVRVRRMTTADIEAHQAILIAEARLSLADRSLQHGRKCTRLTPKEAELAESLFHCRGTVVRYEALYSDVLGRKFGGDTSNMRVLLGKLIASFGRIGINLRDWIEVVPKTGYRLAASAPDTQPPAKLSAKRRRSASAACDAHKRRRS